MDEYIKLFQYYSPLITPTISLVTFVIGMFVGNWLALGRDRRKEINELSSPVRLRLVKQIELMQAGQYLPSGIVVDDIYAITDRVSKSKSDAIKAAFRSYSESTTYDGLKCYASAGRRTEIGDFDPAIKEAKSLLQLLPLKN
jgi:hypothetical protein